MLKKSFFIFYFPLLLFAEDLMTSDHDGCLYGRLKSDHTLCMLHLNACFVPINTIALII